MTKPPSSTTTRWYPTTEQLKDNLGAAGLHLAAEEIEQLDIASDPGAADYPYGAAGIEQRNRTAPLR